MLCEVRLGIPDGQVAPLGIRGKARVSETIPEPT
jgi:hypothetical protein